MAFLQKKMDDSEKREKDREFQDLLKNIEMESAHRLHSVKSKKRELRTSQRESKKKVEKIKEERSQEYKTSEETRKVMNETYKNMELTSKAHTFAEWCSECNCIHLENLLTEEDVHADHQSDEKTKQ